MGQKQHRETMTMKRLYMFSFLFALALAFLSFDAHADSFSCDGGIISTGDRNSDVIAKCGSPDFRDSHQEEVVQRLDADTKQKIYITVEEWTYNLGPNQFTRIVTLKNGRVAEIKTGNYGYVKP
jgi:hypothetical protein